MNLQNKEHIITIRVLCDGIIEKHSWRYSIRQCQKRNLVELRIPLKRENSGERYQHSFYGATEAEARKRTKSHLMDRFGFGEDTDDGYTISAWVKKYIELNSRDWSYKAIKTNQSYVRLYIDPMIGHHFLSEFKTEDFMRFYDVLKQKKSIANQYKNTDPDNIPYLSTQYINKICSFLHGAIESAVDRELILRNPVRTNLFTKTMHKKTRALPKSLFPHFYNAIKNSPYKNYYLFVLATAERRNEALAIRKRDIDGQFIVLSLQLLRLKAGDKPSREMIVIDKRPNKNGEMIYHVLVPPKCASSRTIFITPFIRALLDEQLSRISNPLIQERNKQEFLFVNDEGRFFGESTVGKDLKKCLTNYKDKTGIDLTIFTIHSLRDTTASWLFGLNADNLVISRQLGHSSVNVTNARYRDYIHNEDAELGYLRKKESLEAFIEKTIESIEADIETDI